MTNSSHFHPAEVAVVSEGYGATSEIHGSESEIRIAKDTGLKLHM